MSNIEHLYESLKKQEMVLDKLRVEFNLLGTPDKFKRFKEVESPIFEKNRQPYQKNQQQEAQDMTFT